MDTPQYNPLSPVTPLAAEELDALDRLLQALPADGAMSLDGLDGYFSGLLVGPPAVLQGLPSADWLPAVWGGDPPGDDAGAAPFASKRQRKDTVVRLLRHLRHLDQQFQAERDGWEPIFSIAEQGVRDWVDARDWCAGFLQAVDLAPQAWGDTWHDAALAPVLAPLLQLGGGLDGVDGAAGSAPAVDIEAAEAVDALSRQVPDAVLALLARRDGAR